MNPATVWYKDADNDGFSDGTTKVQCTRPVGYKLASELSATSGDCDDSSAAQNPDAIWYKDADGDGYSDGTTQAQCARPEGYKLASELSATSGDCDDSSAAQNPDAIWYKDADGDGYSDGTTQAQCARPEGYKLASELTAISGDCDDSSAAQNPDAIWYKDADGDGYSDGTTKVQCVRPEGYKLASELTATSGDCDDSSAAQNPDAIWYKDADNDGYSDGTTKVQCVRPEGYKLASELTATSGDCDDTDAAFNPTTTWYKDTDGDGYSDGNTLTSCARPTSYKLASELNGIDEDCDDSNPLVTTGPTWYKDADDDGFSDGTTLTQCTRPPGYKLASDLAATSGDCDDGSAAINPGTTWYKDADGDGYSDGTTQTQCTRPAGYKLASELTATSGDADDSDPDVYPGSTTGSVAGTITDEQGQPLEGVKVSLNGPTYNDTYTDAEGNYRFSQIDSGLYRIYANPAGGTPARPDYVGTYFAADGGTPDYDRAAQVSLGGGQALTGLNITVPLGGSISGRVTDGSGNPIANSCIDAWGDSSGSASSDADGYYTIRGLLGQVKLYNNGAAGNYVGGYWTSTGMVYAYSSAEKLNVTSGQAISDVNFALSVGASLKGTVHDTQGNPVSSLEVNAHVGDPCGDFSYVAWGYTNAQGEFTMSGVPAQVNVFVSTWPNTTYPYVYWDGNQGTTTCGQASQLNLDPSSEVTGLDLVVPLAGSMRGTITDTKGQAIANMEVYLSTEKCGGDRLASARTGSSGAYSIEGLAPGSVYVHTSQYDEGPSYEPYHYDGGAGNTDCNQAQAVTITGGSTTENINLSLPAAGAVAGTVTDDTGEPIANVEVYATSGQCGSGWLASGRTGSSGEYSIHGLTPGSVYVHSGLYDGGPNYVPYHWDGDTGGINCNLAQAVAVTSGDTTENINLSLVAGGSVTGTVTDSAGDPVANLWVYAHSSKCGSSSSGGVTGASGEYSIHGVMPGTTYLVTNPDQTGLIYPQRWWTSDEAGVYNCRNAEGFEVTTGQTSTDKNFVLAAGAKIIGKVSDSSGQGIPGAAVQVYSGQCWQNQVGWTTTDSSGNYSLTVPAGNVYLLSCPSCNGQLYYQELWYDGGDGVLSCSEAGQLSLAADSTTTVDFNHPAAGAISGRVTDAQGAGIARVSVKLVGFPEAMITNSEGYYTLGGVTPGTYVVKACPTCMGLQYADEYWDDSPTQEGATGVAINAGQTTGDINFTLTTAPEIEVKVGETDIPSGSGSYGFGSVSQGSNRSASFTISNPGTAALSLSGSPVVAISGINASEFAVTTEPSASVAVDGSTSLVIQFAPQGTGYREAQVSIANNDGNENPYTFTISGVGLLAGGSIAPYVAPGLLNPVVGSIKLSSGDIYKFYITRVSGPGPLDAKVTIAQPGGETVETDSQDYWWLTGIRYKYVSEGVPADGSYTFTVSDTAGRSADKTVSFTYDDSVPAPTLTAPAADAHIEGTTPTLSIDTLPEGTVVDFRVYAYDNTDVMVWRSGGVGTNSVTVPAPYLQANTPYTWRAFVIKPCGNGGYNIGLSDLRHFYTGAKATSPFFDPAGHTTFSMNGGLYDNVWAGLAGLAPWDIPGFKMEVTLGSGSPQDLTLFSQIRLREPAIYMNAHPIEAALSDLTVTLKVTDDQGKSATAWVDYTNGPVPTVSDTGRTPVYNDYLDSETPTFSWSAVTGENLRYRLRIYSQVGGAIVYNSPITTATSVTVPSGVLLAGCSYAWVVQVWDAHMRNMSMSSRLPFTLKMASDQLDLRTLNDVTEGDGTTPMRVRVLAPVAADLTINLVSSDSSELTVPATVTIPAGQDQVTFNATVVDDGEPDGRQSVSISASATGWRSDTETVLVNDSAPKALLFDMPSSVSEASGGSTAQVYVADAVSSDLTITLSSSNTDQLVVSPTQVTIAAGETSASFLVRAIDDTLTDGDATVTVSATAEGWEGAGQEVVAQDDDFGTKQGLDSNVLLSVLFESYSTTSDSQDSDGDGILDSVEIRSGSDPGNPDTDYDGISDGEEDANHNGEVDADETDPTKWDTDGDGLSDKEEMDAGTDPLVKNDDATTDSDGDGLTDLEESQLGTNKDKADTDGDGMPDGWEHTYGLNPLSDDASGDPDNDGLTNLEEYQRGTDPSKADSDEDGMPDGWEVDHGLDPLSATDAAEDKDSDGLSNLHECMLGTDPAVADSDGDGLADGVEDANQNGVLDEGETDPTKSDTDGDGFSDYEEIQAGTDPLSAASVPVTSLPFLVPLLLD